MNGRLSGARLHVVAILCVLPLGLALGRTVWLQAVRGAELRRQADSQQIRRVYQPPVRGEITDRNGVVLARSQYNHSIVAEPAKVKDPARTARILARILGTSPARIEKKLRMHRRGQVDVWRQVTPSLERRREWKDLPGISERVDLKRLYPEGPSAAHVVGYLDAEGRGRSGIERELDSLLQGRPGWATEFCDARGRRYPALGKQSKPAVPGYNVVLTLDAAFQDVAASELRRQVEALDAKGGALVAVDPRTGEVLALASWPSFDPERVGSADKEALRNRVIGTAYEPGSTFKLVPAATALMHGLLEPSTPISCEEGTYRLAGRTFRDHHPYGVLPFRSCFAVSSNIAFAKVGELCGELLYPTAHALGFGEATGLPLPGEDRGLLRDPARRKWSRTSAPTLAIGYELLATPMQLAMAYATVANDGVRMRPRLVKAILDPDGHVVYRTRPQPVRRVMEPSVARTLLSFLRGVMTEGTASSIGISWVNVGGKTGTAEKYADGRYWPSRHYASFVGIAPIEDPELVCFVMIDEPKGRTFGATAAAPVFREVLESLGRLPGARLAPEYATVSVPMPSKGGVKAWVSPELTAGPEPKAIRTFPVEGGGIPDVRGHSLRQALLLLRPYGVQVRVRGSGLVRTQVPGPGSRPDGPVTLVCRREAGSVGLRHARSGRRQAEESRGARLAAVGGR